MRFWILLLVLASSMNAAIIRLFLSDGGYHLVREYEVLSDRVRFYSTERGQWEEMPLDLVDLKRTENYHKSQKVDLAAQDVLLKAEEQFERQLAKTVSKVPMNPGAYWLHGEEVKTIPQAELKVNTSKKRTILQVLTPVPIVAGKSTIEVDGKQSKFVVSGAAPELFLRLDALEQFFLVKLDPKKDSRVVQTWEIVPVSKEVFEKQTEIPVLKQELMEGLYKLWPEKPLEPGEYAVVQFSPGQQNLKVWDFSLAGPVKAQ